MRPLRYDDDGPCTCPCNPGVCEHKNYRIDAEDSGLDGWNDGELTITDEDGGVVQVVNFVVDTNPRFEGLCMPAGCYTATWTNPSTKPEEITWKLMEETGGASETILARFPYVHAAC
jgi:hypothetical protein